MSCESGDITLFILSLFICHEVSHDFVGGVPSSSITNLLGLVSIGLLELEIMEFVVSISISISIPMLRFQCRGLQMAHQRCSIKKAVLTNFTMFIGKHLCWSFFKVAGLNAFCEYFENLKYTYFEEHLWTTASVYFIINFFLSQKSFFITVWKRSQKLLFVLKNFSFASFLQIFFILALAQSF